MDSGHSSISYVVGTLDYRPSSAMSGMELGSPLQSANMALRAATPTYNGARSPTAGAFADANGSPGGIFDEGRSPSRRSSKQTQHASTATFSLGMPNALLLSPLANSSRSSLESAGSSYHTWDEDHRTDRLHGLFTSLDPDAAPWHDIGFGGSGAEGEGEGAVSTAGTSPYDATEVEDAVQRETGLSKNDFTQIQDKLVGAALTKAATPENRRAGSIRRRRPSTSQSNYSFNGERVRFVSLYVCNSDLYIVFPAAGGRVDTSAPASATESAPEVTIASRGSRIAAARDKRANGEGKRTPQRGRG